MTLSAIPPATRVTETTCVKRSPSNSRGSSGIFASASIPAAARWIALSANHGRAEWPLTPEKVQSALMLPRQPAWIALPVGSMTMTASAVRRPGSRSSRRLSALSANGSSSRPKKTKPTSTFARSPSPPSASSIITASAPFMSAAPRPWTTPSSVRPGRLSWAGTVSRWPARRTSGRSPRAVAPARTQVSPASRASTPPERRTSRTRAASVASSRDSEGTSISSRVRAARRSAGDIRRRMLRGARDHTRRRARRQRVREVRLGDPAQVGMVEVDGDRARLGEAEGRAAVGDELAPHVARRGEERVAGLALAPRAGLELADLLERVDADLRVAADREADAGVAVAQRREESVAQVALGRRARHDDRPRPREEVDVAVGDVDAVDDARALAEESAAREQLDRRAAVLGVALGELAALLVGVDVEDEAVLAGVGADRLEPGRRDRPDAVRGEADRDPVAVRRPRAQVVDAAQERRDVGVAEAPLARLRRPVGTVPAVAVVGGGEEDDPQAGRDRRLGDRDRHRVR